MPDLMGHINELKAMHKVSEGDINKIYEPTVLFFHTNDTEILDLANADTNPPQNLQENGSTLTVNTHKSPTNSPLEKNSVTSAEPLPCPCVKDRDATLQACAGDLPDARLLGADYIICGVYQDWVRQNLGEHLDGGIANDSKWQAPWKN